MVPFSALLSTVTSFLIVMYPSLAKLSSKEPFLSTSISEAFVPAGAVEKETDIAITSFVPAADKKLKEVADKAVSTSTPQTTSSALALSSFDCQPDGVKFEKPLEIRVKALEADNDVYFTEVKHYVNGTDNAEVIYDDSDKSYVLQLDGFSVPAYK